MVNTNGATISLKTIMFDNANGHYAIYRTNGSSFISMVGSGTSASAINVVAGKHAMHAEVTMNSSLNVDRGAASSLTFHAALSGVSAFSLTETGAGTLFFESNSNYSGNTEIRSGLVSLLAGSTPLGSDTVSIYSGGTLDLNNRTLAHTINAFSGGTPLDTGSSSAIHVSGTALFSGTTDGTINIAQSRYGDFLGVVSRADVTISSGGTATFQNPVTEYGTVSVLSGGQATVSGTAGGVFSVSGAAGRHRGVPVGQPDQQRLADHRSLQHSRSHIRHDHQRHGRPHEVGCRHTDARRPQLLLRSYHHRRRHGRPLGHRLDRHRRAAKAVTTPASGSPIA